MISFTTIGATLTLILQERNHLSPPASSEDLPKHLAAAVAWLLEAQKAAGDGGLAASYSPLRGEWTPAYPETTGYTIPTLLAYARQFGEPAVRRAALAMAEYELRVQDPSGGFPAMQERRGEPYRLVAFDTGQVVLGLLPAYQETGEAVYATAVERACDWLVNQQNPEGWWEDYHGQRSLLAIDTRIAYALALAAQVSGEVRYRQAAVRQLDWTLNQQSPSGWVAYSSFQNGAPSVLHSLAYVAEGFLEGGWLLQDERYVAAAGRMAQALAVHQRADGFLAGAFRARWQPAAGWACLTGQAQIALVWLRLVEIGAVAEQGASRTAWREAARKALFYTTAAQRLEHPDPGVRGGIPGSRPFYGRYLPLKYPNWAVKFFLDAGLAWLRSEREQ